ncbi:complex I subunit 5 family protein [Caldanaerovirga acetigignens]|uniref:complex I subunit 5 family protein n=1 Tax=Caldanaerovirga acetigignens TaxID=447595 RepID=UPI0018E06E73|nr:proton-conducting transporter membrane subunit [Caldanaerovirga acetigignens]
MGPIRYWIGGWIPPIGIELYADKLSVFMAALFLSCALLILISFESFKYEIGEERAAYYFMLVSILIGAMLGIIFTRDLFNLYVFVEITTIAACGIISIKNEKKAVKAALKYFILSSIASTSILLGLILIYNISGFLHYDTLKYVLLEYKDVFPKIISGSLVLTISGFSLKSALFPLHVWLPDAHSAAPTPSSALLSGLVIKIYVFVIIRLLNDVFGLMNTYTSILLEVLLALGNIGVFFGAVLAGFQNDIKKRLAYSSVSQMGYVFLGLGFNNQYGFEGALLQILNHALAKSCLFLATGRMIKLIGSRDIKGLEKISNKLPLTALCFSLCAMSLVGIPFTLGFLSKWYLAMAAIESGRTLQLIFIILSALLTFGYYFPVIVKTFTGDKSFKKDLEPEKTDKGNLISILMFTFIVLFLGIFPGFLLQYL